MPSQNRILATFQELARKGDHALICYIVAGYPDLKTTQRVVEALVAGGADIIEIGIPFSDPIADGPTIQAAASHAIARGTKPQDALELAASIRRTHPNLPILVMTYYNIIFRAGVEKFMKLASDCGVDGFIVPDMPFEEADNYVKMASTLGLSTVFLASPNTPQDRLKRILEFTSGFLYLVSVFGITGARMSFEEYTRNAIKSTKLAAGTKVPLAVGFGISTPAQAHYMLAAGADAVIVGSAIIDRISKSVGQKGKMLRDLEKYARSMKKACKK